MSTYLAQLNKGVPCGENTNLYEQISEYKCRIYDQTIAKEVKD